MLWPTEPAIVKELHASIQSSGGALPVHRQSPYVSELRMRWQLC